MIVIRRKRAVGKVRDGFLCRVRGITSSTHNSRGTALKVFKDARRLLVETGWTKGTFEEGGAHCVVGATRWAARHNGLSTDLGHRLGSALSNLVEDGHSVTEYNDQPGMTKRRILGLLDTAIETLEDK